MARASKYEDTRDDLLSVIARAQLSHGKSPSVRDLADQFDVGVATIHSYLQKLAEEGVVEWRRGRHRSLRCTPLGIQELS